MINLICPKCGDGDLSFELEEASNGPDPRDGFLQIWHYTNLIDKTCDCEFTPRELEKLEEDAVCEAFEGS